MAAKKQHVAAQATLGELLWRGNEVRQREARGLALITLAHENAKASGKEPKWIGDLYAEAFATSDAATRKEAARAAARARRSRLPPTDDRPPRSKPANSIDAAGDGAPGKAGRAACGRRASLPTPFRSASRARRRQRRLGSRSASATESTDAEGLKP